jgi:hypothetical protein
MRADAIRYLNEAGFNFKSVESPDLWTHLESHFYGKQRVDSRFEHLPATAIADIIMKGEDVLLEALMQEHKATGRLAPVARVLDMPFVVGRTSAIRASQAKSDEVLMLIEQPGTAAERVIRLLPVGIDKIPTTHHATVTGGLYADGHTVGFFDVNPGDNVAEISSVYLATPDEILSLVREMEANAEDVTLVTQAECSAMIKRAMKALKR